MPYMVNGQFNNPRLTSVIGKDFNYSYSKGRNMRPGKELHDETLSHLLRLVNLSHTAMRVRYPAWRKIDHTLTAFTYVDEEDQEALDKDAKKPVSIVLPYSYAVLETTLSFLGSVFYQTPIFKYEGHAPEDTMGAMLLELAVQWQMDKGRAPLALNTWFRSALAYGIGALAPRWEVEGKREYNKLEPIDPYRFFFDPSVTPTNIQSGEFVAWVSPSSYLNLLGEERDGDYFNVRYLQGMMSGLTQFLPEDSRSEQFGGHLVLPTTDITNVDVITVMVNLIPKEWKLGSSEYPEKWVFEIAADTIIIKAEPLNLVHQKYPVVVIAPESDGFTTTPLGRLEVTYGMQHILDFLFNSHMKNVRKAVNDMLVVDPYLINVRDLQDPKAGKIIRMRRPGWGKGVKDAVMQLGISDITRQNIGDADWIAALMQKVSGTDDALMGVMRNKGPERLTQSEYQGTNKGAMGRMNRLAQIISLQGMQDLGEMIAEQTRQLMKEEVYAKVNGEWAERIKTDFGVEVARGKMSIDLKSIDIDFDVEVKDNSQGGGNFSEALLQFYQMTLQNPQLVQEVDTFRLFSHILMGMGVKNVSEFRRQKPQSTQIMPDQQVADQVQRGNLMPIVPSEPVPPLV